MQVNTPPEKAKWRGYPYKKKNNNNFLNSRILPNADVKVCNIHVKAKPSPENLVMIIIDSHTSR